MLANGSERFSAGQGFFSSSNLPESATFAWSGVNSSAGKGGFIIEAILSDGTSEYFRHRGRLHRLSEAEANEQLASYSSMFAEAKMLNDPYSYSEQSKAFGRRSQVLSIVGISEKIREILSVKVVRFDRKIDALVGEWENWYAPIIYLRSIAERLIVNFGPIVPLLTDPLELSKYLENWKSSSMPLVDHEVVILGDDREFDDFVNQVIEDGFQPVINPVFTLLGEEVMLISGHRLVLLESLMKESGG